VRLILDQVAVVPATPVPLDRTPGAETAAPSPEQPGRVVRVDKTTIEVATGEDRLAILRLQPSGKRSMATAEFLRGHAVRVGDLFCT
jgi:methionyl-tRNA formyltransferase